jgi:hypothetical protein
MKRGGRQVQKVTLKSSQLSYELLEKITLQVREGKEKQQMHKERSA